jgi:putative methionine-R-sulfoxide reductase with GAF domain
VSIAVGERFGMAEPMPSRIDRGRLAERYRASAERVARAAHGLPDDAIEARMRAVVDAIWEDFNALEVSWVGFYLPSPAEGPVTELILGPSRNKPACSPIGLHGVCGQGFVGRTERVVGDVRDLGAGYVACDPRDASEIVLPIARAASPGPLLGVIDLDSHATHRFGQEDSDGLRLVLAAAGFAVPPK